MGKRKEVCKHIGNIESIAGSNTPSSREVLNEDSDTDDSSDLEDDDDSNIEQEYIEDNKNGGRWRMDYEFMEPNVRDKYNNKLRRNSRNTSIDDGDVPSGLKISRNTVNSPIKAWSYIFTETILNKIAKYTNDYGSYNCSR